MRHPDVWLVVWLVMFWSGLVYGDELYVQPSWRSSAVGGFDKTGNQQQIRLYNVLADTREQKFRFYSSSAAPSQYDGGTAESVSSLSGTMGYRKSLEVVPFSGYQVGGEFEDEQTETKLELSDASNWGFLVDYDYTKYSQIEFYYSHQETELSSGGLITGDQLFDVDVDYYHIGGTFKLDHGKWEPFVVGTLGLTRFDPESSEADSLTRFSLGLGGGVRYFPTKRVGLYLGGRAFVTFVESEFTYVSDRDGTTLTISSNALWQFQFMAGVVIVF
ncbi:MAG: hypothetical protein ACYTBJ_17125 [Planctomycetota bacterium]|jgi:opacity protein-like surface antigen